MRVIVGDKSVRMPYEYAMRLIEQGIAEPADDKGQARNDNAAPAPRQAEKPAGGRRRTKNAGT